MQKCPWCAKATTDGHLCRACQSHTANTLHEIATLWPELQTTITRQDHIGNNTGRHTTSEPPLPYRPNAAHLAEQITGTLRAWTGATTWNVPAMCHTLATQIPDRAKQPDVTALVERTESIHAAIIRTIDRPKDRAYLGPCPNCHMTRFADADQPTHTCTCGTTTLTAQALAERQAMMSDMLVTFTELATIAEIPKRRLRWWIESRQLQPTTTWDGHAMYRYADAKTLQERHAEKPTMLDKPNGLQVR